MYNAQVEQSAIKLYDQLVLGTVESPSTDTDIRRWWRKTRNVKETKVLKIPFLGTCNARIRIQLSVKPNKTPFRQLTEFRREKSEDKGAKEIEISPPSSKGDSS